MKTATASWHGRPGLHSTVGDTDGNTDGDTDGNTDGNTDGATAAP